MEAKVTLDFLEIRERLKSCILPEVDRVVGIGTGGIVPASLVAYELNRPLTILSINYRAPDNNPRYHEPKLLGELALFEEPERIVPPETKLTHCQRLSAEDLVQAGTMTLSLQLQA